MDPRVASALELLDPPKGFKPWHGGPTLAGALRTVDHEQALWKPAPDRHSIWELALHIGYWRYAVRRRLEPDSSKGYGRSPTNWPRVAEATPDGWKEDQNLIQQEHQKLIEAIRRFPAARLDEPVPGKTAWTFHQLISGIAAHDTYHIGQLQLMKRLYSEQFAR
jgi:hypothetical protein